MLNKKIIEMIKLHESLFCKSKINKTLESLANINNASSNNSENMEEFPLVCTQVESRNESIDIPYGPYEQVTNTNSIKYYVKQIFDKLMGTNSKIEVLKIDQGTETDYFFIDKMLVQILSPKDFNKAYYNFYNEIPNHKLRGFVVHYLWGPSTGYAFIKQSTLVRVMQCVGH